MQACSEQVQSRMTSLCLLFLVFNVSCFAASSRHEASMTTLPQVIYPGRVLSRRQEGCSTDALREIVAEVNEDLNNILHHIRIYNDCKDALTRGQTTSGVYTIQPDNQPGFQAYCDMETDGGGWTVFQRRMDGSVDFYRNWTDYQQGFGNLSGEFWLGLDKIHRLTSTPTELQVDLQDFEGNSVYAQYTSFSVGDSASKYVLTVSGYSGTAGDSLAYHNGNRFSTRDQENDAWIDNCAQTFKGAWWYKSCYHSNLNGLYHIGSNTTNSVGVHWYAWRGYSYSLKFTEMKLRHS